MSGNDPRSDRPSGLHFDAAVFDLDGIVTRTARVHARAWKELFDELLRERAGGGSFRPFDIEADYLPYVDGKPRYQGVRSFLESRGIELPFGTPEDGSDQLTVCGLGNKKNRFFAEILEEDGAEVFPTTVALIRELRHLGVRVAVASSSKNCQMVLRRAGLEELFEARVDGVVSAQLKLTGKPAPDIFVRSAQMVGAMPARTIVFEDAVSGVQAGRAGRFGLVVGVDRAGQALALRENGADLVVSDLAEVSLSELDLWFARRDARRPSALTSWDQIAESLRRGSPGYVLRYGGALVGGPEGENNAPVSAETREALSELADAAPVVVLSSADPGEVARAVGLESVAYAGGEGRDVIEPGGHHSRFAAPPGPAELLEVLEPPGAEPLPVCVGDPTADEDAFAAVAAEGLSVSVTKVPRSTQARYWLQGPSEVAEFLRRAAHLPKEASSRPEG